LDETVTDLLTEASRDMAGEGFDPEDLAYSLGVVIRDPAADGSDTERLLEVTGDWQSNPQAAIAETIDREAPNPDDATATMIELQSAGPTPELTLPEMELADPEPPADAIKEHRETYWEGEFHETPVYQREDLNPGNEIKDRAIVESRYTTYVIEDGWTYSIDEYGHGHVRR
jgi:N-methylhydantoinase A/oxoprolinase/acetone carboxylase beta subunit